MITLTSIVVALSRQETQTSANKANRNPKSSNRCIVVHHMAARQKEQYVGKKRMSLLASTVLGLHVPTNDMWNDHPTIKTPTFKIKGSNESQPNN